MSLRRLVLALMFELTLGVMVRAQSGDFMMPEDSDKLMHY